MSTHAEMSERALRDRVFDGLPIGIAVFRREGSPASGSFRLLTYNATAEKASGGSLSRGAIGRTIDETFPQVMTTELPQIFQRALATGETQTIPQARTGAQRPDHAFEARASPIGSDLVVVSFENATELAAANAKHEQLEQQIRAAQRLEAIGLLAGGIAHDFNNVLTVIQSCATFLLEDLPDGDAAREDVTEIREAAERAARLTDQLLAFSRRQPQKLRILDLNEILAELDKMLRRIIGEDVDLMTKLEPNLGRVRADRAQIEQILMNLAINSRDAMPKGGSLTIETANVELSDTYGAAKGVAVPPGRYVLLAVSDSGTGMDQETQQRVFEPFFTRNKAGGTGLGLSTVYGIVKQSDGHIWVYSEPGKGSTFKIYLPRVEGNSTRPPAPEPTPVRHGMETLLLVEDEPTVRRVASRILTSAGYTVLEAANGTDALRLSLEHATPIDLLLTDVVMPTMSGKDLATKITTARPDIRVLFMSGYAEGAVVHHGVLDEGTAYLQKPFSRDGLLQMVRNVLDRRGSSVP